MGAFNWAFQIFGMNGGPSREIEATVDTGTAYLLRELGVEPTGQRRFLLADGRRVDMNVGRAWITINGASEVTVVAFGEDDAPPLLGAYTLEGAGAGHGPPLAAVGSHAPHHVRTAVAAALWTRRKPHT